MRINDKLREIQCKWNQNILFPFIDNNPGNKLSWPFYFSVSEEYENAKNRIMIVGQEARGNKPYNADLSMDYIRAEWIEYYRRQMFDIGQEKYSKNSSPFWKLFRLLNENNIVASWNNIDKMYQIIDGKTKGLTTDIENELCKPFGCDSKSLISYEIEISKPKLVLFITGPLYHNAMEKSFNMATDIKPNKNNFICDISSKVNIGIHTIWTYHPKYLNSIRKINECVEFVKNYLCL